jgi:hypothetical protein
MKSELIKSIGYGQQTKQMEVEYRDDGAVFVYFGVPFSTFKALVRADSSKIKSAGSEWLKLRHQFTFKEVT